MDIKGAGAASWDMSAAANYSGDCGGNTMKALGTAAFTAAATQTALVHTVVVLDTVAVASGTRSGRDLGWYSGCGSLRVRVFRNPSDEPVLERIACLLVPGAIK